MAQAPRLPGDRFVDLGLIDGGGSSNVVKAFDKELCREVAIKVLTPEVTEDDPEGHRFTEEARIAGQLEHPNIVPVYEFGRLDDGYRYMCMRLVTGENLETVLLRLGDSRLEPEHLAKLLQAFAIVCDAVAYAHSRSVLHRDIKPQNIMLGAFDQVYLLDWGLARICPGLGLGPQVRLGALDEEERHKQRSGAMLGTPPYAAPEQIQGRSEAIDQRTDVFGLGATLYRILSGQPPVTSEIALALWNRQHPRPIALPESLVDAERVPSELSKITLRALSFDPAGRHATVVDLKRDLEAFQRGTWHLPQLRFVAGTVIVREGEAGDTAYVIQEGRCSVYRNDAGTEVEVRVMGPGDVFGETAVFLGRPRTASVRALTDVVVLTVTSRVLASVLGLNSPMGAFIRTLAERFIEADKRVRSFDDDERRRRGPF